MNLPTCKAKLIDLMAGHRVIVLNPRDAEIFSIRAHDRIKAKHNDMSVIAEIELSKTLVSTGEAGIPRDLIDHFRIQSGDEIELEPVPPPSSLSHIRRKIGGQRLKREEIYGIVQDVVEGRLSELEMAGFLLAEEFHGMEEQELLALTQAIAETGSTIDFGRPVCDKHSVGGIPGNKVSLLIVPIIAAAGLLIPKTSSRAITSPSGTADTMSVLANVEFEAEELRKMVLRTNGAIIWGGSLSLAPADDIFINIEHPLQIDPEPQMIASILAKKLAVGAQFLVLDIPVGKEAKIESFEQGRRVGNRIIEIGEKLGVRVKCGITYGGQPVGYSVGPCLEAREALEALEGAGPQSLVEKSVSIAGMLLELSGKVVRGAGQTLANEILTSRKALEKMRQIIETQGGDPKVTSKDLKPGPYTAGLDAPADGYVTHVSNRAINQIARTAGAPAERGAGILFFKKEGHKVKKGERIFEIYSERESKLTAAHDLALKLQPIRIEGMLLEEIPEY
jgi:AMP phosphorylase